MTRSLIQICNNVEPYLDILYVLQITATDFPGVRVWSLHLLDEIRLYTHGKEVVSLSRSFHSVKFKSRLDKRWKPGKPFLKIRDEAHGTVCDVMLHMYSAANADNCRCISHGLRLVELGIAGWKSHRKTWRDFGASKQWQNHPYRCQLNANKLLA